MSDTTPNGGQVLVWRTYRVVGSNLVSRTPERVQVTAEDEAGDLLIWTAQPDRSPRVGVEVQVTMRPQQDPPDDEQPPAAASSLSPLGGYEPRSEK